MDTTDPLIEFDSAGRCSHCRRVDSYADRWNPLGDAASLSRMIDRIRRDGRGRDYDVAIGISGGVDSSYLVSKAREWSLRVLAVHVDTGWNSELAVMNIEKLLAALDVDLVTEVVDWDAMRNLQLAFLRSGVPNQDIPQDHVIMAGFYRVAGLHNVVWSLNGANLSSECILPAAWGYDNKDLLHIRAINARFGNARIDALPTLSYAQHALRNHVLKGIQTASPLNMIPYRKSDAMAELSQRFGWKYYGGKHYESRFTKFFQGWYLPTRWGFDKRLAHLSSLAVTGQMSRDEALAEFEHGQLPTAEIEADLLYMSNKLELEREDFDVLMKVPLRSHEEFPQTAPRWRRAMSRLGAVGQRIRR